MADRGPLDIRWDLAPLRHKRHPSAAWVEPPHPLGALLRGLLGITRVIWRHTDAGPMAIPGRPAPSGGGLYPIEAYVAGPDGLFHYDPVHEVLEVLRPGDHGPARICLTAVFWRSMFKYGDYAYRLICQEIGVLRTQAEVVAATLGLTVTPGDPDDVLLGLDGSRESVLAVLHVKPNENAMPRTGMRTAEQAGCARTRQPSAGGPASPRPLPPGAARDLHQAADADPRMKRGAEQPACHRRPGSGPGAVDLRDGLRARHSPVAGFRPAPVPPAQIAAMAGMAASPGLDLYLLALRVDGLPRAAYHYDGDLRQVRAAPLEILGCGPSSPTPGRP